MENIADARIKAVFFANRESVVGAGDGLGVTTNLVSARARETIAQTIENK